MEDSDETDDSTFETEQEGNSNNESESVADKSEHLPSNANRPSIHVTVQREDISAACIQEDGEELLGLDIDVYDQQTYEKSVFDQVDKAITCSDKDDREADIRASEKNPSVNINDLMHVIHDDEQQQGTSSVDPQQRDEHILELTRRERINRESIKQENTQEFIDEFQPLRSIPKVPKISKINIKNEYGIESDPQPTTSHFGSTQAKIEPFDLIDLSNEVLSESEDSNGSQYQPQQAEIEDDSDDIDYETDSDVQKDNDLEKDIKGKKVKDDGDFKTYARRIKALNRARAQIRLDNILDDGTEFKQLDELVDIDGSLQIPKDVWDNLYEHQKTGVRWLWELHQLGTGGILGDEMGLGKTIQMIAFLIALRCSKIVNMHNGYDNLGPVVLVCPATVMHQWLVEFRKWYPTFRVAILHSTGSFCGDRKQLIKVIHKSNGILICSFPGVVIYQDYLHALDWHYAILDEGHKIRNPDAQVTLACKRFRTPHRLILSGSPVQNNLRELWSIFDFIYPGKLGTLPVFMGQFGIPITQGGYANATDIQVQIAYKCACVLRDTIKPFLLRRTKAEVNNKLKLPERSEQVLFCKLTEKQRKLYEQYLSSPTVRDIKRGMCQIFVGLIQMRKICNHPDLFDATECMRQIVQKKKHEESKLKHLEFFSTDETFGHYEKSGKMMVVHALLRLWKKQNHKVLLFTQSRQMLKIFVNYVKECGYKFLWMDGSTPIGTRHSLIDDFNNDDELFIFLLTTRVGGVGVNLIGANRIIIYDPDWNPSTDIQARERAWRIGQQRQVIIYRLLTAGTIEEKIYHRQVFKLYLTNRILRDAKQKRFFKTNDLHELFTLGHDDKNIETKALFDDDLQIDEKSIKKSKKHDKTGEKIRNKEKKKKKKRRISSDENSLEPSGPLLSDEKLKEMRERARRLSLMIGLQYGNQADESATSSEARIKTEQLNLEPDVTRYQEITGTDFLNKETEGVVDDTFSPTKPVPYCPAWSACPLTDSSNPSNERTKATKSHRIRVEHLIKQDLYRPAKETHSKDTTDYQRDDYILGRLFKNSNIAGALKHDKIEDDSVADFKVVESEAEKVARDAIRALKESRRMCLSSASGIPNWTGRNGQIATQRRLVPKNKGRAQQVIRSQTSSSNESLISVIKKRNHLNPVPLRDDLADDSEDEERNRDFVGTAKETGGELMADKIREFLLNQTSNRGEAQTDELLEFFKKTFESEKTALFKAILYKLCELQRRGDKGFWRLKSEFRDLSS